MGPAGVGVDLYRQKEAFLYDFRTGGKVPVLPASGREKEKNYVLAWTEQSDPAGADPRQRPKVTTWMAFLRP